MYNWYEMTLHLTVGTIGKIWLKNYFTLLLRLNIFFRVTWQDCQTHHTEAEEKEKSQTAEISNIVAIHDYIICEFYFSPRRCRKSNP